MMHFKGDGWEAFLVINTYTEDNWYYAESEILDLIGYGNDKQEALSSFKITLELFMDDIIERNTFKEVFQDIAFTDDQKIIINPLPLK